MFRTEIIPQKSNYQFGYNDRLFTIGSCFSDSIGHRLEQSKFDVLSNPFGTIFHPIAISKALDYAINNKVPPAESYLVNEGVHLNFDFHSKLSALSPGELKILLDGTIKQTGEYLEKAEWLLITFGTAIGYSLKSNGNLVANCHKVSSKEFTKNVTPTDNIVKEVNSCLESVNTINPQVQIILTLSPVRHLKETLEQNSLSKSILRVAINEICSTFKNVSYFPAYELLLDDLRDYRFYKSDMLHPSEEAENYIWEKFKSVYMDEPSKSLNQEWDNLRKSLNHTPFQPMSNAHQTFLKKTLKQLKGLNKSLDLSSEIAKIQKQLTR